MIMIWNRKEVFMGYSLQKFNEVCKILNTNRIRYKYRIVDNNDSYLFGLGGRGRRSTLGENLNYSNLYYIYVHKNDYDNARIVLH